MSQKQGDGIARAQVRKGLFGGVWLGLLIAGGGFLAKITGMMALGFFVFVACGYLFLVSGAPPAAKSPSR